MNNVKLIYPNERTKAGELMSKEIPLQKIDYANNHKRCDDDLRLAERLATASKYAGIALACFALWFVVLHLTFKAFEVMQ